MTGLSSIPLVPVSWGELLDKITILEIKRQRMRDPAKWTNVDKEWRLLSDIAHSAVKEHGVASLLIELKSVNEALWDVEDAIRAKEAEGDFGSDFVRLARSVYRKNDERAALKRRLNLELNSGLIEEKGYSSLRFLFPLGAAERERADGEGKLRHSTLKGTARE